MKRCLFCRTSFSSDDWKCPSCTARPAELGGFQAFAPELAITNDGMSPDAHHQLDRLQSGSFWFRVRNRLIIDLTRRHFGGATKILELGCGTGYVLGALQASYPSAQLFGSEIYMTALPYARQRLGDRVQLFQMDARSIPFDGEFDLICAFDVLEHITEDEQVLREIARALRPGGGLLLSVPQHPSLWSTADELACHKRRYRRSDLVSKCRAAGFELVASTSFVSSLLPMMILQRWTRGRQKGYDAGSELVLPRLLDRTFEAILDLERRAIAAGLALPVGGSLFMAARKAQSSVATHESNAAR